MHNNYVMPVSLATHVYIEVSYTYSVSLQWREFVKLIQNSRSACTDRHKYHLDTLIWIGS